MSKYVAIIDFLSYGYSSLHFTMRFCTLDMSKMCLYVILDE